MSADQTRARQANRQNDPSHNEPGHNEQDAEGPSPLLEQAQAWANVAREAHEHCIRGDEAERMLERRQNASGQ
jgi:hypothetical protein